ncbi:MAG: SGNH/GDSL hydrolase family protein [Pirellulales bacterium]
MKRFCFKILAVTISLALSLFVAEVVVRNISPEQNEFSVTATGNQYKFYQFDETLGWSNRPGMTGTYQRKEFSYEISMNQHAMRQRDVTKARPAGKRRIAVIGDSFVWGIGASDQERVTGLLEEKFTDVEVLNFGVVGYSPVQYEIVTDRVLKEFDVDAVVVMFCLGNDHVDSVLFEQNGYYKPYAVLNEQEGVEVKGYPIPNVKQEHLDDRPMHAPHYHYGSRILALCQEHLVNRSEEKQAGMIGISEDYFYQQSDQLSPKEKQMVADSVKINQELFRRMKENADAHGKYMCVVPAPTKSEYQSGSPNSLCYEKLKKTCDTLQIDCLSTVEHLSMDDFWVSDGHWNLEGNIKISQLIFEHLSQIDWTNPESRYDSSQRLQMTNTKIERK